MRCMHEAQFHRESCFITLTYDDVHLPLGGTLVKKHFQDFMKRLRWSLGEKRIAFFHCGEYGERLGRPHYHAVVFGHDFKDKVLHKRSEVPGEDLYRSEELARLWGHGFAVVGAVSSRSAAYTASYVVKKIGGELAKSHYRRIIPETGEVVQLVPEYATMSKGIGKRWIERYHTEVYPDDFIVVGGKKALVPRYYDKQMQRIAPTKLRAVKLQRLEDGSTRKAKHEQTPERLAVREEVKTAALNLKRKGVLS